MLIADMDLRRAGFSFISTEFVPLLNVKPSTLIPSYVIEVANDIVSRAMLIEKSPYRLAPSKMPELSEQLQELQDKQDCNTQRTMECSQDLVSRAMPIANSPYRLAPLEIPELSKQLQELQDKEVHFLGHVVNNNGIHVDPKKIEAVKNWKAPETPSEIRSFLGLAGDVRTLIMDEAHASRYFIHPGANKMYHDLRDMYWLLGMKKDIATYVSKCLTCSKLPSSSSGYDMIWVIVDRLTKSTYFLAIHEDYKMEKFARIYIGEIVARHGVPVSIIYDRDGRFTSRFWQTLQKALGTRLDMSRAYHPQTDGQSKHTIQTLEDKLRACVINFGGSWDTHLPLAEFSYNNSYHSSIRCASFEALYGRKCRSPVHWAEIGESWLIVLELVQETNDKVFEVGDQVLLKVSPWKGVVRFGKKGNLAPRYVGPFEILERIGLVAYRLRLSQELSSVHDTFHVLNLKKCLTGANLQVPLKEIKVDKTLHFVEEPIEIMDREVKRLKRSRIPIVKVSWNSKEVLSLHRNVRIT
ncbi:putative reverse transcriptase domain-containing protein [Tanacetum coccineum]|uniref:Reverse transcriptase domain-containing protein n=1 Tax=Tanacetum coccineum TaxID=301880 RepID=A0ABQ4ZP03_9ASTR